MGEQFAAEANLLFLPSLVSNQLFTWLALNTRPWMPFAVFAALHVLDVAVTLPWLFGRMSPGVRQNLQLEEEEGRRRRGAAEAKASQA